MKKTVLFLCILVFIFQLFGQDYPVSITSPNSSSSYNILYPTYFDPNNIASQPMLFELKIENVSNDDADQSIEIDLMASMEWRNRMLIHKNRITPEFTHPEHPLIPNRIMNINNRDLITNASSIFEVEQNWDDILDNNPDFKDLVLNMGRFPDGVYVFTFYVQRQNTGERISEDLSITINLRSPNPISLITPGSPIGFGVSKVMDNQPYFVWFSNLANYTLRIWELQHTNYSIQQIEGLTPYLEITDWRETNYPLPAEYAFENNKTYAWQVLGEIDTPAMTSTTYEKSNVYLFQVASDAGEQQDNQLLIQLLNQFSLDEAAGLEELLSLLEDGYELSDEDYQRLMQMFSDGKKVKSIKVD